MIVNPLVGAEQCNVTRLDIVDFTTLMEPGTWDLGPTKKDRNTYPGLPHYPGETVVCLRKVMVTSRRWCSVSILLLCFLPMLF